MVVETFLVVSVASLNFTVVPRSSRTNCFMCNTKIDEQCVKEMHTLRLLRVAELTAIICLYRFRSITKVSNSSLHEIYGRITALLSVRIYETFSGSLVNHRVLVEFLTVFARITSRRDYFNIKLPLNT